MACIFYNMPYVFQSVPKGDENTGNFRKLSTFNIMQYLFRFFFFLNARHKMRFMYFCTR